MLITDRVDDHVSPKPLADLTDAPTLGLEPSRGRSRRKSLRRNAGSQVFRRVEAGEVLARDLGLRIAHEASVRQRSNSIPDPRCAEIA